MEIDDLARMLAKLEGKSYSLYRRLRNATIIYRDFKLKLTKIQGDPHAEPSIVEVLIPNSSHRFSSKFFEEKNITPFTDYISRSLHSICKKHSERCGSGNSCYIGIPKPGPWILRRSSVEVGENKSLILRFYVGLPARGRRVLGGEAVNIFRKKIPSIVKGIILLGEKDYEIMDHIVNYLDQEYLRSWIKSKGYMFFVGNGSILPRESSISQKPLKNAVKFLSPKTLSVKVKLPSNRVIEGLAISKGVLIITGGGYHGKTTLLKAIQEGIYDHIRGDGRELVVSSEKTVTVKAEDGRIIHHVNISSFIRKLPSGELTVDFSNLNASGSTSMAASIIEALEAGVELILFDEDASATNLLYKDEAMAKIISEEPIVPLVNQLRSTVKKTCAGIVGVISASSIPLYVADCIILMEKYVPYDITEYVKKNLCSKRLATLDFKLPQPRVFAGIREFRKAKARGFKITITYSNGEKFELNIKDNPRIVEKGQVKTIAYVINYLCKRQIKKSVPELVEYINNVLSKGFTTLAKPVPPDLTIVNGLDVIWVLNRVLNAVFLLA